MGSGDGRGPYRWARREADRLFIASDANEDTLRAAAWKAARKPARGGVSNLLCVAEPLDALAAALPAAADRVTVILPWADLLSSVATPSPEALASLRALCVPEASIEIVFSYESGRDAAGVGPPELARLEASHVRGPLRRAYESAGLRIRSIESIDSSALARYDTTWSKRLAFGRPREVWRMRAVASPSHVP